MSLHDKPATDQGEWAPSSSAVAPRVSRATRIRSDNLAAVLELVHHSGGVSRSRLTRLTGLNRSTISALVADLVTRRLVIETDPDAAGDVGRPSPIVRPDPRTVAVAVNPELDSLSVALVSLGGTVLSRHRHAFTTPPTPEMAVETAARECGRLISEAGSDHQVIGVGVAVPGLVSSTDGIVRVAPHLRWFDEPIAEMLSAALDLPVRADNDASLGANAERIFGAGQGVSDLIYLNGGESGIGGGIISGGRPLRGRSGFAGEIGHTAVSPSVDRDPSGTPGSLEVGVNRSALSTRLGRTGLDADELQLALVTSTDPVVRHEVESQLRYLAIAIANAVNLLNPELVVLGGFLASLDAAAPGMLRALVLERALPASAEGLEIVPARLGSSLLMIGAAELAFSELLADPTIAEPMITEPRTPVPDHVTS